MSTDGNFSTEGMPASGIKSVLWDRCPCKIAADTDLNCQSEVRIFEEKNEKYHGFTLTKGRVLYIDISRFSEPEGAATNEVGTTLTGC